MYSLARREATHIAACHPWNLRNAQYPEGQAGSRAGSCHLVACDPDHKRICRSGL